jgi:hypothetical protein
MTRARHNRKSGVSPVLAAGLLLGFAVLTAAPAPLTAATTERLVTDWRTGLAIHGFDPVAYFTDRQALAGRPDLEFAFAGAVWRFRNVGNRAAFVTRPEIYAPRFGGYDPFAIARGVATPGHPLFWFISEDRLYLFQSSEARNAFAANPEQAIEAADLKWPDVWKELVP